MTHNPQDDRVGTTDSNETALLAELNSSLQAQLAALAEGRSDEAESQGRVASAIADQLRGRKLSAQGQATLKNSLRLVSQLMLAVRDQQSYVQSQLSHIRDGGKVLRAYGDAGEMEPTR